MGTGATPAEPQRRWWALAILAAAQLLLVLDITIVNIALPAAQADLGLTAESRQWVVTAYVLPFGGLLLLGGRAADHLGRRRSFIVALLGFGLASALGGLAWAGWPLFAARAAQGAFAALMAPALLSSITLLFPSGSDRARAFGVYSAVSAVGGAAGLLIGGVLVEYLSWRWCLLVNAPAVALVALAARALLAESRVAATPRFDLAGGLTVTGGLFAIVFATSRAAEDGWASGMVLGCLISGVALLAAFVVIEHRSADPLLPLRILAHRGRLGVLGTLMLAFAANTGMLLLLVLYLQDTLEMSPLTSGLAFLPFMAGATIGSWGAARLAGRISPRTLMAAGTGLAFAGLLLLAGIEQSSTYSGVVLPALVLDGIGVGLAFVPANSIALFGVPERDAGVTSGTVSATQQVGAALGVAIVNTVAISATSAFLAERGPGADAAASAVVHGYGRGLLVAACLMALASVAAVIGGARADGRVPSPAPSLN